MICALTPVPVWDQRILIKTCFYLRVKDGHLKRKLFKVPKDAENRPPKHHKPTLKRHHSDVTSSKVTQFLHSRGLPSMVSTLTDSRPSYMQPTRAVINRHKGNR